MKIYLVRTHADDDCVGEFSGYGSISHQAFKTRQEAEEKLKSMYDAIIKGYSAMENVVIKEYEREDHVGFAAIYNHLEAIVGGEVKVTGDFDYSRREYWISEIELVE